MTRAKPLILLVDDEPNLLEIMSTKLNASGFETALARNGKEAVAQSVALAPDLILMDIHMPGETGTDAALIIKQNPKTKDLKIAFLTSLKDPWPTTVNIDKAKLSQAIGMEDFIEKTDDLDAIVKKVREILAR
jgi:CheY-like chemotaxis protein